MIVAVSTSVAVMTSVVGPPLVTVDVTVVDDAKIQLQPPEIFAAGAVLYILHDAELWTALFSTGVSAAHEDWYVL